MPASSVAKTAFGYSANEVMQQLGTTPQPSYQAPQPSYPAQQPAPQRQHPASQPPPQRAHPPSQPPGYQQGGLAPSAAANAATMFVQGGPPSAPGPQYGAQSPGYPAPQASSGYGAAPPGPGYGAPSPAAPAYPAPAGGLGIHAPQQVTPAPLPTVPAPFAKSASAGRPIEPWKDSLRLVMFVWGGIALAAFAAPLMTDPMAFNWDAITEGEGKAKIPPLVWAAVGLLGIVFAAIPMPSLPRGALAAVLGLSGIFVPLAVRCIFGEWQNLIQLVGMLALIPGLLVRNEYVESLLARVLVTIGVICMLLPYLVPEGGQIPLVMLIQALLEAGNRMEIVIIALAQIVLAVLCLLAWMPGPATAGAKIFAWAVILLPVASAVLMLLGARDIGAVLTKTPGEFLSAFVPGVAYSVFVGYGLATVIGKQLE